MGVESYSTTPANNNASPPNGAPEGMAPSAVNDVIRQVMADVRAQLQDGQWFNWGHTPSRVDDDTFTVATDLTAVYHVGRRLKVTGSATGYCTIASSSYSAPNTTVNVTMDSGNLPGTLSAVYVSVLSASNAAIPSPLPAVSGANLTALNASNISSGTLADGRLSSNVPLKNAANTFGPAQQTIQASGGNVGLRLTRSSASSGDQLDFYHDGAGVNYIDASGSGGQIRFATAATARGTINASGNWTINAPSSGTTLEVRADSAGRGLNIVSGISGSAQAILSLTASSVREWQLLASQTTGAWVLRDDTIGVNVLTAMPAGGLQIGSPTGGDPGAGGLNVAGPLQRNGVAVALSTDLDALEADKFASGTFTATLTGCTTSPTGTATWYRAGNIVTLVLPAVTGTSNSTSCTMTGLPSAIQPATLSAQTTRVAFSDNSSSVPDVSASVAAGSGTITFIKGTLSAGFTNTGTKGTGAASVITYLLT
jgi:hypothetical protein